MLVAKHGVQSLETSLNGINPGLFCQLLQQVWVTKAKAVTNPFLRKALCVAGSRMLAESNALKQQPHVWAQVASATMELIEMWQKNAVDADSADAMGNEKVCVGIFVRVSLPLVFVLFKVGILVCVSLPLVLSY